MIDDCELLIDPRASGEGPDNLHLVFLSRSTTSLRSQCFPPFQFATWMFFFFFRQAQCSAMFPRGAQHKLTGSEEVGYLDVRVAVKPGTGN